MRGYLACGPVQRRPYRAQPVLGLYWFGAFGPSVLLFVARDCRRQYRLFSRELWRSLGSGFLWACAACFLLVWLLVAYK